MLHRRAFGLATAALATPGLLRAQGARPVTLVVPFAPGGITDSLARLSAEWVSQRLARPIVVENVGGAAGAIALNRVARTRADGSTLLFTNVSALCITPFLTRTEYTPQDFDPISIVGTGPFFLVAGPSLPVNDVAGLVAAAKARPGALSYASAGVSSLTHLATAMVVARAGIEVTHIPYRGAGPAFADLLAGTVHFMTATPAELAPHMGAGQVRVLGVTSPARSPRFPQVPAVAEALPGVEVVTWNGWAAPRGTPGLEEYSRELRAAARDPGFLARLDRLGTDPVDHSPAEFATIIERDAQAWSALVRQLGLSLS